MLALSLIIEHFQWNNLLEVLIISSMRYDFIFFLICPHEMQGQIGTS